MQEHKEETKTEEKPVSNDRAMETGERAVKKTDNRNNMAPMSDKEAESVESGRPE